MNRRFFLNSLALTSVSTLFFAKTTLAQSQPAEPLPECPPLPEPLKIRFEILNNHGHAGALSYESVIIGDSLQIDIQGASGHPHALILNEDDLAALRRHLTVDVKSTVDFGHSHVVRITRDLIP